MKIEEWEKKKELSRAKYDAALTDITGYNARYMEDMTEVSTEPYDVALSVSRVVLHGCRSGCRLASILI